MKFPRLVFKCPGKFSCQGGTYDHKAVEDHAGFDEAIAAGWFASIPEALNPVTTTSDQLQAAIDEEDEPTRDELETKANELGIKYSPNISDAKLAERIAEALKVQ